MDRIPSRWRGDAVTSAHEEGAYTATKYLIKLGHKRIATITGPLSGTSAAERLSGFIRAMKEARLAILPGYIQEAHFDKASGHEKTNALLHLRTRPTAIFAANDLIAFGALAAIRQAGLVCPTDISVIGFDNLDVGDTSPSLSTVDQFVYDLGSKAVQIIVDRVAGDKSSAKRVRMPTELRIKDSTCAPQGIKSSPVKKTIGNSRPSKSR